MSNIDFKIPYVISNGQFAGEHQVATIKINGPGDDDAKLALEGIVAGLNATASGMALFLYMKALRGARQIYRNADDGLAGANPPRPPADQPLSEGESDGENFDVGNMETISEEAGDIASTAVEEEVGAGVLTEATAAGFSAGVAWCIIGGIFGVGALVAAGLLIWEIYERLKSKPLVSVIFVNGIPNSSFRFTDANWDPGMSLVGPDTIDSMLADKAISTMQQAGALQYTWEAAESGTHHGNGKIAFKLDNGPTTNANFTWVFNPETTLAECTLTASSGGELISAYCSKQHSPHVGQDHVALIYLIAPTAAGARKASFTIDPSNPVVYTSLWGAMSSYALFGLYSDKPKPRRFVLTAPFEVGDVDFALTNLQLLLRHNSGTNAAMIALCEDSGEDKAGQVIHQWDPLILPTDGQFHLMTLQAPTGIKLKANTGYWIAADTADPNSSAHWAVTMTVPSIDPRFKKMTQPTFLFAVHGNPISGSG